MTTSTTSALSDARPVGERLRAWRRRRLSQLEPASRAEASTRHLSFVETGRSMPSREMVLRPAESLDVPLRDRNLLLVAAGDAPVYAETPIAEPRVDSVRAALRQVLVGHEPYPAVVVPLRIRAGDRVLSFFSTIATFGTPVDITVAELAVESFYPADRRTGDFLRERAGR